MIDEQYRKTYAITNEQAFYLIKWKKVDVPLLLICGDYKDYNSRFRLHHFFKQVNMLTDFEYKSLYLALDDREEREKNETK